MMRWAFWALLVFPVAGISQELDRGPTEGPWHATGKMGVVAGGGKKAVDAGLEILKKGGNAIDAGVATTFALSVTDAKLFCFGGEVPIIIYDRHRKVVEVLAGQGVAPKLATPDQFRTLAQGQLDIPAKGIMSATVPAVLDACLVALDRYGTKSFTDTIQPTLRLLEAGQLDWHADFARTLRRLVDAEKDAPDRKIGLIRVADAFYRGPIAREIDVWSRANGGLLRYADLATHTTRIEEPLRVNYRGFEILKCGPWTQGPYALQALRLLEAYDLKKMGHHRPDSIHVTVEAMRLALADRDFFYGDPLFSVIPMKNLLSEEYTTLRRGLIAMEKSSTSHRPGDPESMKALLDLPRDLKGPGGPSTDTTTCLAADAAGNMFVATPSGWSGVVAGTTGVWLGTRLQSFSTWPNNPNSLEPGKRPRITLTPGMVLKDGKPIIGVSVAGGDGQDQAAIQVLLNLLDFGMKPDEAVKAPRFGTNHHIGSFRQTPPQLGSLIANPEIAADVLENLKKRGHNVTLQKNALWAPTVITVDPQSGILHAAGDPRAKRHAVGY